jgi:drug/metabolite transporter (DMT)-like permease
MTTVMAVFIEKKAPTRFEGCSLLVLTLGVMLAVWQGTGGSMRSILLCIAGGAWYV